MPKSELNKDDIIKLLGLKVKTVGGEIDKLSGSDISNKEMHWYVINKIDKIHTLLFEYIVEAEKKFVTKKQSYKMITCIISITTILVIYLAR